MTPDYKYLLHGRAGRAILYPGCRFILFFTGTAMSMAVTAESVRSTIVRPVGVLTTLTERMAVRGACGPRLDRHDFGRP